MNKKKLQKLFKNKKFIIVLGLVLIGIICLILLKMILSPNGNVSKYGNRLDGIEKIEFSKSDKNKVVDSLKEKENVTEAKINVHGKIINIIFNVEKNTSTDDAKAIANESLINLSEEIKNFYDVQIIITMYDEETEENGNKVFPIMGYKNSSSKELVW